MPFLYVPDSLDSGMAAFDFEISRPGHFKKVATIFKTHLLERTGTNQNFQVLIGLVLKDLKEKL